MATYELDELQAQIIYMALRGDSNESTLLKTKKLLEAQKLNHAVVDVQTQLALLQGSGVDNPGLLRIFNPQHDLLAATPKTSKAPSDQRQREMFKTTGQPTADAEQPAPVATGDDITWADDVPYPRPAAGQFVVGPSGHAVSVETPMGYDPERKAFRIIDADGWDGFVFSYGFGDQQQWRILTSAGAYEDESDMDKQPGEPSTTELANELHGSLANVDDDEGRMDTDNKATEQQVAQGEYEPTDADGAEQGSTGTPVTETQAPPPAKPVVASRGSSTQRERNAKQAGVRKPAAAKKATAKKTAAKKGGKKGK